MSDKTDYTKLGYDRFMRRNYNPPTEQTEDETSTGTPGVRLGGVRKLIGSDSSQDGKTTLDWTEGQATFSDGARDRVLIGNLNKTGIYGIRVLDKLGNIKFESSDDRQFINIAGNQVTVSTEESGDFTSLKDAVDEMNELGGGTIFVKSGTYYITEDITINYPLTIIGDNSDDPNQTAGVKLDFLSGTSQILIESHNVVLDSLRFRSAMSTEGVVKVVNPYPTYANTGRAGFILRNCEFEFCATCILLDNAFQFLIERCSAIDVDNFVNGIRPSVGNKITSCYLSVNNSAIHGDDTFGSFRDLTVENCYISGINDNVISGKLDNFVFTGNTIFNFASTVANAAIHMEVGSDDFRITSNYIFSDSCGILVERQNYRGVIANNYISGGINGVNLDGDVRYTRITSNYIHGGTNSVKIASNAVINTIIVANNLDGSISDIGTGTVNANNA